MDLSGANTVAWIAARWELAPWWGKIIYVWLTTCAVAVACLFWTAGVEHSNETHLH